MVKLTVPGGDVIRRRRRWSVGHSIIILSQLTVSLFHELTVPWRSQSKFFVLAEHPKIQPKIIFFFTVKEIYQQHMLLICAVNTSFCSLIRAPIVKHVIKYHRYWWPGFPHQSSPVIYGGVESLWSWHAPMDLKSHCFKKICQNSLHSTLSLKFIITIPGRLLTESSVWSVPVAIPKGSLGCTVVVDMHSSWTEQSQQIWIKGVPIKWEEAI